MAVNSWRGDLARRGDSVPGPPPSCLEFVGWVERSETRHNARGGFRGVHHRAGHRPDPVAQPTLRPRVRKWVG